MAATGVQMNWTAVGFTPSGGSLTPLTKITDVSIDYGGTLIGFSGDNDRFSTVKVNNMNDPKVTLSGANAGVFMALVPGTVGAFTATHKDAKGATGGDIVYVMANAVIGSPTTSGSHAQFGTASLPIESYSTDGSTSPLGFTRV